MPILFNLNGLINLRLKNWENSVQVFQKAIDCDDKFVEAYNNIGIAYSHFGKEDKAIENYSGELDIILGNLFLLKGKVFDLQGDRRNAIEYYKKCIGLNNLSSAI